MIHNIQIKKDSIIKTVDPVELHIEIEKTRRAYAIGSESGLFRVPRVLDIDEDAYRIIYERLSLRPVSTLSWGERGRIVKKLGRALAVVHSQLTLPEYMCISLPEPLALPLDEVFFHGDLSVDNVCVNTMNSELILIDWQMTRHYGGRATFGTRYFDLFWFITNLIVRPYTRFIVSDPVTPIVEIFLKEYFYTSGLRADTDKLRKYANVFFPLEMERSYEEIIQNSKGRARFLFPWCKSILKRILRLFQELDQ